MNIPGSIQRELDAAREEGRREGLREAIAHCEARFDECIKTAMAVAASIRGESYMLSLMTDLATLYMAIAGELKAKVPND